MSNTITILYNIDIHWNNEVRNNGVSFGSRSDPNNMTKIAPSICLS